jgi:predicted membrane-bound spermidine synthase
MFNKRVPNWVLYVSLLVEGGALMAVELIGAKIIAPFYGVSLYVWASILGITLAGLAGGYYVGGALSKKHPDQKTLYFTIMLAAVLVLLMPFTGPAILAVDMGLKLGIIVSSIVFLMPQLFCFGMVGPLVVNLIAKRIENIGNTSGTVYFTSTIGGIISTFYFGFYAVPYLGLMKSTFIVGTLLLMLPVVFVLIGKKEPK